MKSCTTLGPLFVLTDPSTRAPAWAREEAHLDVTDALADAMFRRINPVRPANPFVKQISAMPQALVPSLDARASSITVVRRSCEVGYHRLYRGFMEDAPANPPFVATFDYILTSPPSFEASDSEDPRKVQLTTARNLRGRHTDHLVACNRAEYLSCATATRSRLYLSTPAWWYGVEVPYGTTAELPWVHA